MEDMQKQYTEEKSCSVVEIRKCEGRKLYQTDLSV